MRGFVFSRTKMKRRVTEMKGQIKCATRICVQFIENGVREMINGNIYERTQFMPLVHGEMEERARDRERERATPKLNNKQF